MQPSTQIILPLSEGGVPCKAPDWSKPIKGGKKPLWRIPRKDRIIKVLRGFAGSPGEMAIVMAIGRIGLDVGGVLLNRYSQEGAPLKTEEYPHSEMFVGARAAVRLLVYLFGPEHVFILKNNGRRRLAKQSLRRLMRLDFFEGTGVRKENYLVIPRRAEKWRACWDRGIDFMVDDKAQVLRYLPPHTMAIQYGETPPKEEPEHPRAIGKRVKKKTMRFSRTHNWRQTFEVILEHYDITREDMLVGRTSRERADIIALWKELYQEQEEEE